MPFVCFYDSLRLVASVLDQLPIKQMSRDASHLSIRCVKCHMHTHVQLSLLHDKCVTLDKLWQSIICSFFIHDVMSLPDPGRFHLQ